MKYNVEDLTSSILENNKKSIDIFQKPTSEMISIFNQSTSPVKIEIYIASGIQVMKNRNPIDID